MHESQVNRTLLNGPKGSVHDAEQMRPSGGFAKKKERDQSSRGKMNLKKKNYYITREKLLFKTHRYNTAAAAAAAAAVAYR